jgi:autotransporter translocation and assembly factor TamB
VTETEHLRGSTTGFAEVSGSLEAIEDSNASIRVSDLSVQWGEAAARLESPMVINGQRRRLNIEPFTIVGKEAALNVAGSLSDQMHLAMTFQGRVSLEYLELLGTPFVSTHGNVLLDVQVDHSAPRGWALEGKATLERAALDFGMPVSFTDAAGTVVAHGRVLEVEQFVASSGGGEIRINGTVDLDRTRSSVEGERCSARQSRASRP